jgi:hypothetical protein
MVYIVFRIEEKIGPVSLRAVVTMWHFFGFLLTAAYSAVL